MTNETLNSIIDNRGWLGSSKQRESHSPFLVVFMHNLYHPLCIPTKKERVHFRNGVITGMAYSEMYGIITINRRRVTLV